MLLAGTRLLPRFLQHLTAADPLNKVDYTTVQFFGTQYSALSTHDSHTVQRTFHAFAAFVHDVSVDHGSRHVLVSQQFLHGSNVVTGFKKMGCEPMSLMPSSA